MAQCSQNAIEIPNNGIDEDCDNLDGIFLHLPANIYMVEGKDFELYFRNIILSTHPQDYVFEVQTALNGVNANGKWAFTPTFSNAGEHALTVRVKAPSGQLLASASTIVRISPAATPSSVSSKTMIMTGHSFVNQGYMPYYYRLLTEEPGNPTITLKGKQPNWVDGISVHEAIGGASWNFFLKNSSSAYWYFGRFDMNRYFNDVLCQGCRPDMFLIHLDVADYCFPGVLEANTIQEVSDFVDADYAANVAPFIAALRAAAPNTKIAICYASPPNSREAAFISHFGASSILSNRYRWKKIVNTLYFKYDQYFRGRENENIYLLPIHLDIDDVNEFDQNDPVHPWKIGQTLTEGSGYKEIAKTTYAWTKYILNLGTNGACLLNNSTTNINCNNNGTPLNPADDTYGFDLMVNGLNASGSWNGTINGQYTSGAYGQTKNVSGLSIGAGPINFTVRDQVNAACTNLIQVTPPATCSNGSGSTIDLNINMTNSPQSPAVYSNFSVTLTVQNTNPLAAAGVKVSIPKPSTVTYQSANPFTASKGDFRWYSDFIWDVGSLPPLGSATITINYYLLSAAPFSLYAEVKAASPTDSDSTPGNGNGTTANEDDEFVLNINSATTSCALSASVAAITCSNNSTANNPSDDTYTFSLTVNGTGTGTNGWSTTVNGSTVLGQFGQAKNMGPYPISGGNLNLSIKDVTKPTCTITQNVTAPAACSSGGGGQTDLQLTMTGSATSVPIYALFTGTIQVKNTSSTAATGVTVRLPEPAGAVFQGGNAGSATKGTFEWWNDLWVVGNLAAGETATLTANYFTLTATSVRFFTEVATASPADVDSSPGNGNNTTAREDDEAIYDLNGGGTTCSITAAVSSVLCSDNNTPNITTDDRYSFDLLVSGTGNAWTTTVNGQTISGVHGVSQNLGPFNISGGNVSFTLRDAADNNCTKLVSVTAPAPCSVPVVGGCPSVSNFPWHEWISRVQIGTFIKNSSKAAYTNYTFPVVTMQKGSGQSLLLAMTYSYYTYDEYVKIWIDYNHNGAYDEPSELAFSGVLSAPAPQANISKNLTGTISIPTSALTGPTTMRVSMKRGAYPSPCESLPFGEVEDYAVDILANSIMPSVVGASASDQVLSFYAAAHAGTVALDWTANVAAKNFKILRSTDGVVFEKIGELTKTNAQAIETLEYTDEEAVIGLNYYQIQATTADDLEFFSVVRQVELKVKPQTAMLFPNPTRAHTTVRLAEKPQEPVQVVVYTAFGKQIQNVEYNGLSQDLNLDTSLFPAGFYTVQILEVGKRPIVLKLSIQE